MNTQKGIQKCVNKIHEKYILQNSSQFSVISVLEFGLQWSEPENFLGRAYTLCNKVK